MAEPTRSDERTLHCCHLVYALAPEGMSRREADDLFNRYIAEPERGVVAAHDHFIDRAGAFAVFAVQNEAQRSALRNPGPLAGWQIAAHPLVFSPDGPGFYTQSDSTLRRFRRIRLDQGPPDEQGAHDYRFVEGAGSVPR